jgi:hypothetical protein
MNFDHWRRFPFTYCAQQPEEQGCGQSSPAMAAGATTAMDVKKIMVAAKLFMETLV